MSIGERRNRIVFQTATESQDAFGEPDQTWATLATVWGLVQELKGSERVRANEKYAGVDTRIVVRNSSTLASLGPKARATWSGHTYDIKAVIPRDHRRNELEILAVEHL